MLVTRFVFQVNEMWSQNRIWSNFSGAGSLFYNNNNKKEKKICLMVYVWMDVEGEEEEAEQANQQGGLLHQPAAHWAPQHCGGRGEGGGGGATFLRGKVTARWKYHYAVEM